MVAVWPGIPDRQLEQLVSVRGYGIAGAVIKDISKFGRQFDAR
jgi:hypothetical protein